MKAADLREKSVEDLSELQKTLTHDVFQNRLKNFTNRLDDTSAIRKSRRDLARVNTLLREPKGSSAAAAAKPVAEGPETVQGRPPRPKRSRRRPRAKKSTAKKSEAK